MKRRILQDVGFLGLTNVSFENKNDRWVVWDGDASKAEQLKNLDPYAIVVLYDRETETYTRYTTTVKHQKPTMKNGQLTYEEEIIEI